MRWTILIVVFISCLIPSGAALQCYQCKTTTNKNCTYLQYHRSTIKPQECVGNGSLTENGLIPNCMKILTTNYHGKIVIHQVVRQCLWKSENENPCLLPETVRPYAVHRTAHQTCDICSNKDGCNSGSSLKFLWNSVVFGVMISAFELFLV